MKLYVTEMYDGNTMDRIILGVFSTQAKAERSASSYFDAMERKNIEMIDWNYENGIHTYYYSSNHTLTILELELDKEID